MLRVVPLAGEPLGAVAGVLVQALPDGEAEALEVVRPVLGERLLEGLNRGLPAAALSQALLREGAQVLEEGRSASPAPARSSGRSTRSRRWARATCSSSTASRAAPR